MLYQIIATVTMIIHFGFLAYVVVGGFLAWKWPRLIWPHVILAAWGFSTVVFGFECPLTDVEDWARRKAGEQGLTTGFIDSYLEGVIYPERFAGLMQLLAGVVVAISWAGVVAKRVRNRPNPT